MKFHRIKFSKEATEALDKMRGKVGLTRNYLCRIGLCLSLNDSAIPDPKDYKSNGELEIDRKVLLGNEDMLYIALLRERCLQDKIKQSKMLDYFKAHLNRGVLLLAKRVNNIKDLAYLIPSK